MSAAAPLKAIGRYVLYDEIASGGMATVHLGSMRAPAGFVRTVAIKRSHAHFAKDPEFVSMLLDEGRLAGSIHHPNVVATLDVVHEADELFLVMEYVQGESLARLLTLARVRNEAIPLSILSGIMSGVLYGLHAAHEARASDGTALGIVHRDVSPQNVLVGLDGIARVLDFGIATAASRLQSTREGQLKGKLRYIAPERLHDDRVDRRVDIYSAAVMLWEALTGRRLFVADNHAAMVKKIVEAEIPPPSTVVPEIPPELDAVVMRGLARIPDNRYSDASQMAEALEAAVAPARSREIGAWVASLAKPDLDARAQMLAALDNTISRQHQQQGVGTVARTETAASRGSDDREIAGGLWIDDPVGSEGDLGARSAAVTRPNRGRVVVGTIGAMAIVFTSFLIARSLLRAPVAPPSAITEVREPLAPPAVSMGADSLSPEPALSTTAIGVREGDVPASRVERGRTNMTRPPRRSAPGCDPPFTRERDGTKVYKPQCL